MDQYNKIISAAKILIFFCAYSLLEILGEEWLLLMGGNSETQPYLSDTLSCLLMLVFYGGILGLSYKESYRQKGILNLNAKAYATATAMTLGVGGISFCWLTLVGETLQNIPFIQESTNRFQEIEALMKQEPYFLIFLSVVTLGPIVEELIFRGLIFKEAEKIKNGWFPVIVSAVLFGIFHLEFVQIVYTIIMGLVFGVIYQMTRSLVLVCYLHILNNLIATPPPFLETDLFFDVCTFIQLLMILPAVYFMFSWIRIYQKATLTKDSSS